MKDTKTLLLGYFRTENSSDFEKWAIENNAPTVSNGLGHEFWDTFIVCDKEWEVVLLHEGDGFFENVYQITKK